MVFLLCLVSGCGYRLTGTAVLLPEHIHSLAIPLFENKTDQPAIEQVLTNAMIERFLSLPKVKITAPDKAQAIFEGTIKSYSWKQPLAFDNTLGVTEYQMKVILDVRIREVGTNKVIWERKNIRKITEFSGSGGLSAKEIAENKAVEQIAKEIARRVFALLEGF